MNGELMNQRQAKFVQAYLETGNAAESAMDFMARVDWNRPLPWQEEPSVPSWQWLSAALRLALPHATAAGRSDKSKITRLILRTKSARVYQGIASRAVHPVLKHTRMDGHSNRQRRNTPSMATVHDTAQMP
jgi:hypothetical protein